MLPSAHSAFALSFKRSGVGSSCRTIHMSGSQTAMPKQMQIRVLSLYQGNMQLPMLLVREHAGCDVANFKADARTLGCCGTCPGWPGHSGAGSKPGVVKSAARKVVRSATPQRSAAASECCTSAESSSMPTAASQAVSSVQSRPIIACNKRPFTYSSLKLAARHCVMMKLADVLNTVNSEGSG